MTAPGSSAMPPHKQSPLKKTVKQRNGDLHRLQAPPPPQLSAIPPTDYHSELVDFLAMRNKDNAPSTLSAIPSQELIWIRDKSNNRPSSEFPAMPSPAGPAPVETIQIDDEIEDGEIVETEVTGIVNLLAESFAAVTKSKQLFVDLSTPFNQENFYEDRSNSKFGAVPRYKAFGNDPNESTEHASDVICLDSSQENDDSVIFVSEQRKTPTAQRKITRLVTPNCLKSPAVNRILGLTAPPAMKSKQSPKRQLRLALWKEKKVKQFAEINALKAAEQKKSEAAAGQSPSTSQQAFAKAPKAPEKRIILIDGSNMAMGFTDNYGYKKTDKDFSAEGLKIGIEHFEQLGFQVKAVVPEFRVRREKSSNQAIMRILQETGKLVCTPSKCYDDRVILESAVRLDAAVVSNDHYRDLLNEKPEFREVVSRLIRFNWLFQKLIIVEDPHGRDGPKLNEILYKNPVQS